MAHGKKNSGMKRIGLLLGVCAALLLGAMSKTSCAYPVTNDFPDFRVSTITNQYSDSSFTSIGIAENYISPLGAETSLYHIGIPSIFELTATFGTSSTTGFFRIYKDDGDLGYNGEEVYLSGNLNSFTEDSTTYQFLFATILGDTYSDDYKNFVGHINLSKNGSNYGDGDGDIKTLVNPVPEPSTVMLLLLGVGGLCLHRRRKTQA